MGKFHYWSYSINPPKKYHDTKNDKRNKKIFIFKKDNFK